MSSGRDTAGNLTRQLRRDIDHLAGRADGTHEAASVSAAMRMSIGSVVETPTPTAGPLMAAMTGLSDRKMRSTSMPAAIPVLPGSAAC